MKSNDSHGAKLKCDLVFSKVLNLTRDELNFTYELVEATKYGLTHEDQSGILGQVHSQRANFSIVPLSIIQSRSELVDFTTPLDFAGNHNHFKLAGAHAHQFQRP